MAASSHSPASILRALLTTVNDDIKPLTVQGVASGSKLFGAAILSRKTLEPVIVATNNEKVSPLLHGEVNCIQQFFTVLDPASRPSVKDCIFLATHEPCSLCLSAIAWAGFDNFYYMFTYEDSRDLFAIPYDIQILSEVFRVPVHGESMSIFTSFLSRDMRMFHITLGSGDISWRCSCNIILDCFAC
jgi:tRNA(Arg) A34 adenosine deaminase TadA